MLLSFEIPTRHIDEFYPLEDLEFGLAHLFLKPEFPGAEVYLKRYQGCLLDNSMYELGAPLSTDALLKASETANPIAVIAPDWMDEREKTVAALEELMKQRPKNVSWTVAGVVQGKDYPDRKKCFAEMTQLKASPICFPFRSPREETIPHLFRDNRLQEGQWYHLLGLRDIRELTWDPPGVWSCDTGKPFKSYSLADEKEIRGKGPIKLHDEMGIYARRVALWNIAFMRQKTTSTERTKLMNQILSPRRKHVK
jgi:hypothetical protein